MVGRNQLSLSIQTIGNVHLGLCPLGHLGISSVGMVHVARVLSHCTKNLKSVA
jgi:hypothetical protein